MIYRIKRFIDCFLRFYFGQKLGRRVSYTKSMKHVNSYHVPMTTCVCPYESSGKMERFSRALLARSSCSLLEHSRVLC